MRDLMKELEQTANEPEIDSDKEYDRLDKEKRKESYLKDKQHYDNLVELHTRLEEEKG